MITTLVQVGALVALAVPLAVYLLQDFLIFHPQPLTQARRADIAKRYPAVNEVELSAADGTRLHAWQVRAAGPAVPTVLYFGGNAEEVSWMIEAIGEPRLGPTPAVNWWLLDYRGYGGSEGRPSETALVADALALYDHVVEQPATDRTRVFAFGRSLGSGVATALASRRELAGVILVTPYDSLTAVAKHYYPYLPVNWMLRHRFDSIELAPRLRVPLLCVIAGQDEVIPAAHAERLFAAWAGTKRRLRIDRSGHNDTDVAPEFWPAVATFLRAPRP